MTQAKERKTPTSTNLIILHIIIEVSDQTQGAVSNQTERGKTGGERFPLEPSVFPICMASYLPLDGEPYSTPIIGVKEYESCHMK